MKKKLSFLVIFLLLSLSVFATIDNQKVHSGDTLVLSTKSFDNVYFAGGSVKVTEDVDGDILGAAGEIDISSNVEGDISITGGDVRISSDRVFDVRIASGSVMVQSRVLGDLVIAAGDVRIADGTIIEKDALIASGSVTLDGDIQGDAVIRAGDIVITGDIAGDASLIGGDIVLGDETRIYGNLEISDHVTIDESKVTGKITYVETTKHAEPLAGIVLGWLFSVFVIILTFIILALVIVSLSKNYFSNTRVLFDEQVWPMTLYGFIALITVPFLALFLVITIIGIPLALFVILFYFITFVFSYVLGFYVLGNLIVDHLLHKKWNVFFTLALGTVVFMILSKVPLLGGILCAFTLFFGMGTIYYRLFKRVKNEKKTKKKRKKR